MATRKRSFATRVPRAVKAQAGRTDTHLTPLSIRTRNVDLEPDLRTEIRSRAGRKLTKFATMIERVSVRFLDVNGPKGGVDTLCRIKAVLSHVRSIFVESKGEQAIEAFNAALTQIERALRRELGRRVIKAPGPTLDETTGAGLEASPAQGRGDESQPDKSSSREETSTAAANLKGNDAKASYALEDSASDRPSRKSTRRSANRVKADSGLRGKMLQQLNAPGNKSS